MTDALVTVLSFVAGCGVGQLGYCNGRRIERDKLRRAGGPNIEWIDQMTKGGMPRDLVEHMDLAVRQNKTHVAAKLALDYFEQEEKNKK